jgi:hypothetical protein
MTDSIEISYDHLRNFERSLREIANTLAGINHFEHLDFVATGSIRIAQAMIKTDNEWNSNRKKIAGKIDELAKDCIRVVDEFQETDRKLYFKERSSTAGELL